MMRSNSGKDESRNNLNDPTMRDRDLDRGDTATAQKNPKAPADHRIGRKDWPMHNGFRGSYEHPSSTTKPRRSHT